MCEKRKICASCKHLSVVVSQSGDYYCYKKSEYLDRVYGSCSDWCYDPVSLTEKELKVW